MRDNETGTWLARDNDGRILHVDAAGHPGTEASTDDGRPIAEAEDSPTGQREAWLEAQIATVAEYQQKARQYAAIAARLSGYEAESAARAARFCAGVAKRTARTPVPDFTGRARELEPEAG